MPLLPSKRTSTASPTSVISCSVATAATSNTSPVWTTSRPASGRQEVGAAEASDVEGGTLQGRQQGLFGAAEEVETPHSAAFDGAGLGETVTLCMIPRQAFPHVNTPLLQTKDVKSLTIFAQFYLAISCLQQAAIEISQSVLDGGKRPAIVS